MHEGYTVDVVDSDGTLLTDPVDGGDDVEARAAAAGFASVRARADDPAHRVVPVSAVALTGPVVVITGSLGAEDRATLGGVAQHSALPVLLVVTEHVDLGRLRAGGGEPPSCPRAATSPRRGTTRWNRGTPVSGADVTVLRTPRRRRDASLLTAGLFAAIAAALLPVFSVIAPGPWVAGAVLVTAGVLGRVCSCASRGFPPCWPASPRSSSASRC